MYSLGNSHIAFNRDGQNISSNFEGRWEYSPANKNLVGAIDIFECNGKFCEYRFASQYRNSSCDKAGKLQIIDSNFAISRFLVGRTDGEWRADEWEVQFRIDGTKLLVNVVDRIVGAFTQLGFNEEFGWYDYVIEPNVSLTGFSNSSVDNNALASQWCTKGKGTDYIDFVGEYRNKTEMSKSPKEVTSKYSIDCRKLLGGLKPIWAQSMGTIRLENADVMSKEELAGQCLKEGWHCEKNFSGGDGNIETPYQIATSKDLLDLSLKVNASEDSCYRYAHYLQTSDIDATNLKGFVPIGRSQNTPFQGVYNGNGHKISNLKYKFVSRDDRQIVLAGLFGLVSKKKGIESGLSNIHLANSRIIISANGETIVGGIVAVLENSEISNSSAATDISVNFIQKKEIGDCKDVLSGGVIGKTEKSWIENIHFKGKISTKIKYKPRRDMSFCDRNPVYTGGVAGYADNIKIKNATSVGDIVSSADYSDVFSGGVLGYGRGIVMYDSSSRAQVVSSSLLKERVSYNTAHQPHQAYAGGIAAFLDGGYILRSYSEGDQIANSIQGDAIAGGIVALLKASIRDAYSIGKVTATSQKSSSISGGIVAITDGFIQNAYALGSIGSEKTRKEITGGCVGKVSSNESDISFCFYNKSAKGMSGIRAIGDYSHGKESYSNLSPLSLEEFANPDNFVFERNGFFIEKDSSVWYMSADRPRLIWQCIDGEQCIGNHNDKLTSEDISNGMRRVALAVKKCAIDNTGEIAVSVLILADGSVAHAEATGRYSGTPTGNCAAQEVKKATFRKSSMPTVVTNIFHL